MKVASTNNTALLLIDIQKGFEDVQYWGKERNNPDAEQKASELLQVWRERGMPVFHVQHCSQNPASPLNESHAGNAFNDLVRPLPTETVIRKNVNSAFIGTDLLKMLQQEDINRIVVVGLTTDHCVSTTVRMAGNLGLEVFLVSDATATFSKTSWDGHHFPAELIHETALASLHDEFATVLTSAKLLNRLGEPV